VATKIDGMRCQLETDTVQRRFRACRLAVSDWRLLSTILLLRTALMSAVLTLTTTHARAQSNTPTSAPPTAQSQTTKPLQPAQIVTVTGRRSGVRLSTDRVSYDVSNDLLAQTGSLADILRRVPGVEVDVEGNVSLRGDSNVTILIDGRPSSQFEGDGRSGALQSLPASQIARIEVIATPGASLSAEGTGGAINFVTRTNTLEGASGLLRGSASPTGGWTLGVNGSRKVGRSRITGDLAYRALAGEDTLQQQRSRLDPTTSTFINQTINSNNRIATGSNTNGNVALEYNSSDADQLKAEISYQRFKQVTKSEQAFLEAFENGSLINASDRQRVAQFDRTDFDLTTSFRRRLSPQDRTENAIDHEFSIDLGFEQVSSNRLWENETFSQLPSISQRSSRSSAEFASSVGTLDINYDRPIFGQTALRTGLQYRGETTDYENSFVSNSQNMTLTRFNYGQQTATVFAILEKEIGKFVVQGGVRGEHVWIETDQGGNTPQTKTDYARLYPSLFLVYDLGENQRLRASYGRRIQRPTRSDLNPLLIVIDDQNVRQGNSSLRPEITDSFEIGWNYKRGNRDFLATAFARKSTDRLIDVVRLLANRTFLSTRENIGESQRAGLELTTSGRFSTTISYSSSLIWQWTQFDDQSLSREGNAISGRFNFDWQPTKNDFFQVSGNLNGAQLQAQGRREAIGSLNFGYRRKLNERLSLIFTAQNIAGSGSEVLVLDAPDIRERTVRSILPAKLYLGVTYNLGNLPNNRDRKSKPEFEYEQSSPG
jgi:outer membrane receptor protein involved in Fe transport